jgi:hypothetical protein
LRWDIRVVSLPGCVRTAGCDACATLGPLLTAYGTSGRTWVCECGTEWRPVARRTLAADKEQARSRVTDAGCEVPDWLLPSYRTGLPIAMIWCGSRGIAPVRAAQIRHAGARVRLPILALVSACRRVSRGVRVGHSPRLRRSSASSGRPRSP